MAAQKNQRSRQSTTNPSTRPGRKGEDRRRKGKAAGKKAGAAPQPSRCRRVFTYAGELLAGLRRFLPRVGLPLQVDDRRVGWTPRLIAICAILMSFSAAHTLRDRFEDARLATIQLYADSHRKRPGKKYDGFIATLCDKSAQLMELICRTLRTIAQEIAGPYWTVDGWVLFGVDGTKLECPQTQANENALGCAGKKKTTPQQLLVMLLHLGTGVPWAFRRDAGVGSEREQLQQMLGLMPTGSMLVADAGYTGYDLLRQMLALGHHFVIRVGSNVRLLKKLGYAFEEHEGIVYLWPYQKQGRGRGGKAGKLPKDIGKVQEPLVLRLITLHDGRRPVHLLSDVLAPRQLSDQTAARLYKRRWNLELYYRSLKQTMQRRKLLSDAPAQAQVELDWCVMGLWMLGMMHVEALIAQGMDPARASVATGLKAVRLAMKMGRTRWRRRGLRDSLVLAVKDQYRRYGSKQARHPKPKKKERPPGTPHMRQATPEEKSLARRLVAAQAKMQESAANNATLGRVFPAVSSNSHQKSTAA